MNEITIFENEQFGKIRTAGTADNPMFCLSDICKVLDLQTNKVKARLNERGVTSIPTPTHNQFGTEVIQEMIYVNEQNLYKVIMRSDKPQAEPFQDWVCGEVLPSIRKTGSYSIQNYNVPKNFTEALKLAYEQQLQIDQMTLENKELSEDLDKSQKKVGYLRNEVANRKEMMKEQHQQILDLESRNTRLNRQKMKLEDKIATDSDKVKYYDQCHENGDKTLTNFTETAGLLGQKRTLLIDVLLFNGYLYRNRFGKLRAYAKYMDRYFVLKDGNENEYGYVPKNVYVTIEGRKFILENFRRLYKKYNNHINSIK